MTDDQKLSMQERVLRDFDKFCLETGSNPETGELGPSALGAREALEAERFERKLKQGNRTEDLTRPQMTLLGMCLAGTRDNTERWQKVRRGFAAKGAEPLNLAIWRPELREVVAEIDAAYLGQRETRRINGSSISQTYRERVDSGVYNGAVGAFAQLVNELTTFAKRQNEVDFDTSVELTRSAIVKRMMDDKRAEADRLQRGGKPPEAVIAFEREAQMEIDALMQGRSVDDLKLDDTNDWSALEQRMTAAKGQPIPTGFPAIDNAFSGGVVPGYSHRLGLICADSGVGKSQMMVCMAMGLLLNKADVLFISAELTTEETMGRLLANYSYRHNMPIANRTWDSGLPDRSLPRHFEPLKKMWRDAEINGERGQMLLRYENTMAIDTVEQCLQQAKDRNPNISAVFVDHLQAIGPFETNGSMKGHTLIANKVRRLAQLAGQYKVDIFLAAQLNRNANSEEPKKSHIADGYEAVRVAHAMWALDIYKHADGTRDYNRLWLYNLKERTGSQDKNGNDTQSNRVELFGDLNYSYLNQVG